ncbi:hypothetical protein [Pseudoduganella albidiflava]|uniref:Type 4a pilus biogenesis protein PilO n=1 Tax=Pseudoduganella albidiflava TaxID=321983 RepID=A0A411WYZ3_9BURK|nr:hypothetical protein [Pseudoduganella albidiflava]QBI01924.1 hypothetical protein EYF70_14470 [Pseudoduganella albidiflava]GGY38541.1 hypothetical protein GCM10007387_20670 [Pseudoduganella albidiflava]
MDALSTRAAARSAGIRLPLPYWVRDFALVRPAVMTFVITAGISFTCVLASYLQLEQAREDERQAHAMRDAARKRFLYAESEKQEIRAYQPLFVELQRRHFVGTESRLDWVDAIRQIQERRRLLPLTYEIEPQQPYKIEGRLPTGDYQLLGSRMTLHMDLLHEMDLFAFLGDLRQHGVFTVQQCDMRRTAGTAAAPAAPGPAPGLTADCTLNWLTLTPAGRGARTTGSPR